MVDKNYNHSYADLVPLVLCKAFYIHLDIMEEQSDGSLRCFNVLPTGKPLAPIVQIHKKVSTIIA